MDILDIIFSKAADAVFAIDGSRRIVYHNESFANMFGAATGLPRKGRCHEIVCGEGLDGRPFCNPDCSVATALINRRAVEHFDLTVDQTSTEESRWFCVSCFPIPRISGEAVGVCILRPINVFKVLSRLAEAKAGNGASPGSGPRLTRRERQILGMVAAGRGTRAVSQHLHISYVTTRKHIQNILRKLGVHSMAEAVGYVYRNHLI